MLSRILSFFFPPECLGCAREDFLLCPKCLEKIPLEVRKKSFTLPGFQKIFVLTDYEKRLVERAIKQLKFRFAKRILSDLEPFFEKALGAISFPENAVFIPVPLHFLRRNERGFNQSALIAREFSKITQTNIPVVNLLKRIRNATHQSQLHKSERLQNLENAFVVVQRKSNEVAPNTHCILVDDVVTTGSTLIECAKTLREGGFQHIWGLTIARGK